MLWSIIIHWLESRLPFINYRLWIQHQLFILIFTFLPILQQIWEVNSNCSLDEELSKELEELERQEELQKVSSGQSCSQGGEISSQNSPIQVYYFPMGRLHTNSRCNHLLLSPFGKKLQNLYKNNDWIIMHIYRYSL